MWFTADTHFGHANIIEHSSRPFGTIEEHDEALIERWNEVVRPNDEVFHLGDFALTKPGRILETLNRLNGRLSLVLGNHDRPFTRLPYLSDKLHFCGHYRQLDYRGVKIKLFHFPIESWHHWDRGSWHLHGHSHGKTAHRGKRRVDVGVDCWGYRPVSFDELADVMSERVVQR